MNSCKRIFTTIVLSMMAFLSYANENGTIMDDSLSRKVIRLTEMVKVNPEIYLTELVKCLTVNETGTKLKVKKIHDWICENVSYDFKSFNSNDFTNTPVDAYGVIKKGKTVCAGYANLFQEMCDIANIICITISGHAKGVGYVKGESYKINHSWNAVKVDLKWELIDVTWDDCLSETDYFFPDPEVFINDHYPVDNTWQLLEIPVTYDQYLKLDSRVHTSSLGANMTGYSGLTFSTGYTHYYYSSVLNLIAAKDIKIGFMMYRSDNKVFNWDIQLAYSQRRFHQNTSLLNNFQTFYIQHQSEVTVPEYDTLILGDFKMHLVGISLNFNLQLPVKSFICPRIFAGATGSVDVLCSGYKLRDELNVKAGLGLLGERNSSNGGSPYEYYIISDGFENNQLWFTGKYGIGLDFLIPYAGKSKKKKLIGIEFSHEFDLKPFSLKNPTDELQMPGVKNKNDLLKSSCLSIGIILYIK
jgi:hypothetical protein